MAPELDPREWVFCSLPDGTDTSGALFTFRENEAVTVVIEHHVAHEQGWDHTFVSRRITLTVNSSLEAVGFLASVTWRLAEHGIACNAVSAYHHDHLFVPAVLADEAMRVLTALAGSVP